MGLNGEQLLPSDTDNQLLDSHSNGMQFEPNVNNDDNILEALKVMDATNLMLMKYDKDQQVSQLKDNTDIERYIASELYNGTS